MFSKMCSISYSLVFQIFQVSKRILTVLQFSFSFLQPFVTIQFILACFKEDQKNFLFILASLKIYVNIVKKILEHQYPV